MEEGLTAEVLIVIVGARGRRGGCGGDGEVRPSFPTSVMVRSATRRQGCILNSVRLVHKDADNSVRVVRNSASNDEGATG